MLYFFVSLAIFCILILLINMYIYSPNLGKPCFRCFCQQNKLLLNIPNSPGKIKYIIIWLLSVIYNYPIFFLTTDYNKSFFQCTWWTIPEPGGMINMLLKAPAPHFKKVNRSLFLSNSKASFFDNASFEPEKSTCTEWSITKSAGHWGLIEFASPPKILNDQLFLLIFYHIIYLIEIYYQTLVIKMI